ncbi:MAG: UxaA family hydrolase [Clostridia bacterium]|nr:UxaA family hydrolase [Clostridia bacterium]
MSNLYICTPIILFTTGGGTPLGSVVPTVKISTNKTLADKKSNWIDFDGSSYGQDKDLCHKLFDFVIDTANGKKTKNEKNGYEEIAIFKDGVTL